MQTQLRFPFMNKNKPITVIPPHLVKEYQTLLENMVALEHTRADLMGVNQELREKIGALERGQEELLKQIEELKNPTVIGALVEIKVPPYVGMRGLITEAQLRFPSAESIYSVSLGKDLSEIFLRDDEFSLVTKP